ncbi:hypothetical protein [Thermococcus sp.]
MVGIILILKGRMIEGVFVSGFPYATHALLDHYLSLGNYFVSSVVLLLATAVFVVAIYLLIPVIKKEKEKRMGFQQEARMSIEDHWLNKI